MLRGSAPRTLIVLVCAVGTMWAQEFRAIWWALSPGAVRAMLRRLGFGASQVTYHKQPHHLGHRLDEPQTMMEMFTVVARRG